MKCLGLSPCLSVYHTDQEGLTVDQVPLPLVDDFQSYNTSQAVAKFPSPVKLGHPTSAAQGPSSLVPLKIRLQRLTNSGNHEAKRPSGGPISTRLGLQWTLCCRARATQGWHAAAHPRIGIFEVHLQSTTDTKKALCRHTTSHEGPYCPSRVWASQRSERR